MAIPLLGAAGKVLFGSAARSASTGLFAGLFADDVTDQAQEYDVPGSNAAEGLTDQLTWLVRLVAVLALVFVFGQLFDINLG